MKNKIFIAQLPSLNFSVKRIQTSRSIWGEYIRQICTVYRTISLFSFTFAEEPREFLARKQLIWAININHHHMGFQLEEISQLFSPADFRSPFKWLCLPPSLDKRAGGSHTQAWAVWQEVPFILPRMSMSYFEYIIPSALKNSVKIIIKKTEALI